MILLILLLLLELLRRCHLHLRRRISAAHTRGLVPIVRGQGAYPAGALPILLLLLPLLGRAVLCAGVLVLLLEVLIV